MIDQKVYSLKYDVGSHIEWKKTNVSNHKHQNGSPKSIPRLEHLDNMAKRPF